MADMIKTIPPLFSLPALGSPSEPAASKEGGRDRRAQTSHFERMPRRVLEDGTAQLERALANGGRRLLLRRFLEELSKVLDAQDAVLTVLDTSPTWCFSLLNRQFYAIRSAAEVLELNHLAGAAGRAEVLANLLGEGSVTYHANHGGVLRETHALLRKLVDKVIETDSDDGCYPITQTVWSMHAALDPTLCDYEPGEHTERLVAQSIDPKGTGNTDE